MTYDAIGNMLTRGGTTYTWTQGRRLSGVENGKSIKYLYDNIGARVKKTVDNTVTESPIFMYEMYRVTSLPLLTQMEKW